MNLPVNQPGYAVGWGATSEGGSISRQLQNVKLNIYSPSYCGNVQPSMPKNWLQQICAGEINGGKDTCQGCVIILVVFIFNSNKINKNNFKYFKVTRAVHCLSKRM